MCADYVTALGPELALLVQKIPVSRQDSIALSVLRDELEGGQADAGAEGLARSESRPRGLATHRYARWDRWFHRREQLPPACPLRVPA